MAFSEIFVKKNHPVPLKFCVLYKSEPRRFGTNSKGLLHV